MNDPVPGHAPSYYAATAAAAPQRPPLAGTQRADVIIVGAGYTGLNAAITLAEAGRTVVVVEQNRVGWGASGRNGGQLHSGQRRDQGHLEAVCGKETARRLWILAEEAKALALDRIERYGIACDWTPGLIHAVHKESWLADEYRNAERLARDYAYDAIDLLSREELQAAIGTGVYFGGTRDRGAGHLHALNFALGLAAAAESAGARVFEATPALRLADQANGIVVETPKGSVEAEAVLLAGNGYLAGLDAELDARVMPIHNYILTTEPLARERADALIPNREAVADSRFVVHYWRLTRDRRLLFGGGETYSPTFPKDIAGFVRGHMLKIYPQLADVAISHAWGGTLAVTQTRMPCLMRPRPRVYAAAGFSGHGVATAGFAGHIAAQAMLGDSERFDVFAGIEAPRFPGGRLLRWPILVLAMSWFALRDRL